MTQTGTGQIGYRVLGIYLNDHLAGATAGTELAHRVARTHRAQGRCNPGLQPAQRRAQAVVRPGAEGDVLAGVLPVFPPGVRRVWPPRQLVRLAEPRLARTKRPGGDGDAGEADLFQGDPPVAWTGLS